MPWKCRLMGTILKVGTYVSEFHKEKLDIATTLTSGECEVSTDPDPVWHVIDNIFICEHLTGRIFKPISFKFGT